MGYGDYCLAACFIFLLTRDPGHIQILLTLGLPDRSPAENRNLEWAFWFSMTGNFPSSVMNDEYHDNETSCVSGGCITVMTL